MPVLIDLAPRRAVVSQALPQPPAPAAEAAPHQAVPKVVSPPDNASMVAAPRVPAVAPAAISAPASAAVPAPPSTGAPRRTPVAPIIPLTQVPDDPGPEPDTESDSELSRFRQLFR
jgi:hypothetical protein